jgi:hypothetical protein
MNANNIPGFTAEASFYRISVHYSLVSVREEITSGIVPALPSCANCEWACDKCFDCIETGVSWGRCPTCRVCNYCAGRSCSGGGGGGELLCCEFLANPSAGDNCRWCGPTPFPS